MRTRMVCPEPWLLGVYTDAALAEAWGVSSPTVRRWRVAAQQPAVQRSFGRTKSPLPLAVIPVQRTPEKKGPIMALILAGGLGDAEIARRLETSRQYVRTLRIAMGYRRRDGAR